ncbi:carboxypeptidase regulatory-like domain-containing protein [Oceanobacter mangrovi]|uniref:carboxypeptidase regulatory-like domain-containing protein n=1 Tax=Oceanobacter mangrovi TaxID=2862510 RepID=UPI001C8D02E2|nr:carboxypeptidase regulatory-like domain-containing protein [Oceanobacter mangrovi]
MSTWTRVFVLLIAMLPAWAFAASEQIDKATSWLLQQQQAGGQFSSSTLASDWQVSAEVVKALALVDQVSELNTDTLIAFLGSLDAAETEFLSLRIQLNAALNNSIADDLQLLLERQNPDGGFGSEADFDSNSYDTLYALLALAEQPEDHMSSILSALAYLTAAQNVDGSYQFKGNTDNLSDALTARVMTAYAPYLMKADIASNVRLLQQFLLSRLQNSSSSWQTALMLTAVIPYTADTTLSQAAMEELLTAQASDGSWGQDTYTTALALQTLYFFQNIDSVTDPLASVIKGRILAQGQPAVGASVALGSEADSVLTDTDGRFVLNNVTPGSFDIAYSLAGYFSSSQSGSINEAQLMDVGTIELTALPDTGVVSGRISSAEDGAPLAGVSVQVVGDTSVTAVTDSNGDYRIVMAPGDITLSVTLSGYQLLTGSATLHAGRELRFSPLLSLLDGTPQLVTLQGRLVDSGSGDLIPVASVSVNNGTAQFVTDGLFAIADVPVGQILLTFIADGYHDAKATVLVDKAGVVSLGDMLMTADSEPLGVASITGIVTAAEGGSPIANAQVSVSGSAAVLTAADGSFSTTVTPGDVSISVSADGFIDASVSVTLVAGASLTLSPVLQKEIDQMVSITGQVLDKDSGEVLIGALVSVNDGAFSTEMTASGFSLSGLPLGNINLTVSADGYQSIQGSSSALQAGTVNIGTIFLEQDPEKDLVTLTGRVLDDVTGEVLIGALILVNDGAYSTETNADGFTLAGLPQGNIQLDVSADGYQSMQGSSAALQSGTLSLGDIRLQPEQTAETTTINGLVLDAVTGEPLSNALLTITPQPDPQETDPVVLEQDPQVIELRTDAQGSFSATDLAFRYMEILVQATGYLSNIQQLSLAEHGTQLLQIALNSYSAGGIEITDLSTDSDIYAAYTDVPMSVVLDNNSVVARRVSLMAEVFDAQQQSVQQLQIGLDSDAAGSPEPVSLVPGSPVTVTGQWFSGTSAPGQYALVISAYDAMTGQIVAQKQTSFSIEETRELLGVTLLVNPRISRVGADEVVELAATFRYAGNVDASFDLDYQLLNADDQVVLSGSAVVELLSDDTSKTMVLSSDSLTFESSGRYLLQALVPGVAIEISSDWIVVAPATRIEVSQELTPETVLPGSDRTLNVEILLQGVEQK